MVDAIMTHEPVIRLGIFTGVLVAMALWEIIAPRRTQRYRRWQRLPHNLLIVVLDTLAVLIFEVVLNATSMFNHGNVRLPGWLDRRLRLFVVTPEMHSVHHSIVRRETDSNFGFNLPWWDRLFGTYRAQPTAGHLGITFGIEDFREPRDLRLDRMLLQPFLSGPGDVKRTSS